MRKLVEGHIAVALKRIELAKRRARDDQRLGNRTNVALKVSFCVSGWVGAEGGDRPGDMERGEERYHATGPFLTLSSKQTIVSSGKLSDVLTAVHLLELSTHFSIHCRKIVAQHRAVPVLLSLIRSCNRSVHHQRVIGVALAVLRNLVCCSQTVRVVFEVQCIVETLVGLMQVYRTTPELLLPSVGDRAALFRDPEVQICHPARQSHVQDHHQSS